LAHSIGDDKHSLGMNFSNLPAMRRKIHACIYECSDSVLLRWVSRESQPTRDGIIKRIKRINNFSKFFRCANKARNAAGRFKIGEIFSGSHIKFSCLEFEFALKS